MDTRTSSVGVQSVNPPRTEETETHTVITGGDFFELELEVTNEGDQNAPDLEISKLGNS